MLTNPYRRRLSSIGLVALGAAIHACAPQNDAGSPSTSGQGGADAGASLGGQASGAPATAMGGALTTAGTGGSFGGASAGAAPGAGATGGINASGGSGANGGGQVSGGSDSGGATSIAGTAGNSGDAGSNATSGAAGMAVGGVAGTGGAPAAGSGGGSTDPALAKFSFFVTSYPAMKSLSGKAEGFGGDLRFGKADGLSGADEICRQVAEMGMVGAGQKQWRAFLSVMSGPGGGVVHARDRIGTGPWHDRQGRLLANNLDGLFAGARPAGDPLIIDDLPNERGEPNHYVGANGLQATVVDNHDSITGSDAMGRLRAASASETCNDWTSTTATGRPWTGHSWPRSATSGRNWVSDHQVPGCAAGIERTLGGSGSGSCIGCLGGYGGFYCFALP